MIALAAAMPDENAIAVPCSRAPIAASRALVVGAYSREYSMVPPAWKAEAGTMGVFRGWSGPAGGLPVLTTRVSTESSRSGPPACLRSGGRAR